MEESVHPTTLLSLSLERKDEKLFLAFLTPPFPLRSLYREIRNDRIFSFSLFLFPLETSSRSLFDDDSFFLFFFFFFSFFFLIFFFFFFLHPWHARVVKDVQHGASCRYVSQCSSDDVIGVHERRLNERSFGAFADERNCSYVNALDCVNGHSTTRTYVRTYVRTWVGRRIGK